MMYCTLLICIFFSASTSFPSFIQQSRFFNTKLADILCASILGKLTTIIPQPDDYREFILPLCSNILLILCV